MEGARGAKERMALRDEPIGGRVDSSSGCGGRGRSRTHIFHVNKNNNVHRCIHVLEPRNVAEDVANTKIQVGRGR